MANAAEPAVPFPSSSMHPSRSLRGQVFPKGIVIINTYAYLSQHGAPAVTDINDVVNLFSVSVA